MGIDLVGHSTLYGFANNKNLFHLMGVSLSGIIKQARSRHGELWFVIGTLSAPAVSLVSSFIAAAFLDPQTMGVFNTIALISTYLCFLHFGIFTGLSRNLPLSRGKGDLEKANTLTMTSSAVANRVGLIGAAVGCVVVGFTLKSADKMYFWVMLATIPTLLLTPAVTHIDTSLRGYQEFQRLGKAQILSSLVSLGLNGLLVAFGAVGALIRTLLVPVVSLWTRMGNGKWAPALKVNWAEAKSLARVGLPLLFSGTFFSFMMVADRSVVAACMTSKDVGLFALAGMIVNGMQFVPQSVSMILFPAMAKEYGRHGSSKKLRRFYWINLGFNVLTIVPVSILIYYFLDPIVHRFFPKYLDGLPAAKVACLTCVCWIYLGVGSVIGVTNKMTPYLIAMAVSLCLIWALGWWLIRSGFGIVGAAWARFAGTLALCIFTILYSYFLTTRDIPVKD